MAVDVNEILALPESERLRLYVAIEQSLEGRFTYELTEAEIKEIQADLVAVDTDPGLLVDARDVIAELRHRG